MQEEGKRLSPVRISLAYSRHDGRMLRGDRPAIVSRIVARPSSVKSLFSIVAVVVVVVFTLISARDFVARGRLGLSVRDAERI